MSEKKVLRNGKPVFYKAPEYLMIETLEKQLDLERQRSKVLVEGLTIIRDLPHPQFNGERVWTLSDISNATKVASNYLKKYEEMK